MSSVGAFALAATVCFALTPLMIALAGRMGFLDHPIGYKGHKAPTPYLGGTAVFGAFAVAAIAFGGGLGRFATVMACAAGLWLLGTLDDGYAPPPQWRVLAEVAVGIVVYEAGFGWTLFDSGFLDAGLTVIWVVGLVNAFNLMDNLDGATGTVAGVSAAGVGAMALARGDAELGAFAFALCGACLAFLPRNLAGPARIFLGDGGSMPIGLLVAAGAMIVADRDALGGTALLSGALLAGLPILDTALVSFSRTRQGISILTAGRDHLTHRLLTRLGTPRRVALTLAAAQGVLCAAAVAGDQLGRDATGAFAVAAILLGVVAIVILESPRWLPVRSPQSRRPAAPGAREAKLHPAASTERP